MQLVDTPVGHGRIKQMMRSEKYRANVLFAGEHSGHYFYPEFDYVDSGVLTSLRVLAIARQEFLEGRSLTRRLEQWRNNYCWSGERNFTLASAEQIQPVLETICSQNAAEFTRFGVVAGEDKLTCVKSLQADFPFAEQLCPDLKMVRDDGESGVWFVVRPSGNEPRLRLNVEAWGDNCQKECASETGRLVEALHSLGAVPG